MSDILIRIQMYMDKINRGEAKLDKKYIDEFAENCRTLIAKVEEPARDKFTFRVSNAGRPFCALWMEKHGVVSEGNELFFGSKMIFGNMIEAMAIAIIKGAGINVQGEQIHVTTNELIPGTLDLIIDNKVYDVKSASTWSYSNKFQNKTIEEFYEGDTFGYLAQGFLYAEAMKLPFGGFIVIAKETGQFTVYEPEYTEEFRKKVLANVSKTKQRLDNEEPFERCFEDEAEVYYKTPTGHRVLCSTCSFCRYKTTCWKDLQLLPQIPSKAQNRKLVYYTHVEPAKISN